MAQITRVIQRNEHDTIVEITLTVQTVLREGRSTPDMAFDDVPLTDDGFIVAVHEKLDGDPIAEAEMTRICGC